MAARQSRITVGLNISSRLKRFQGAGVQAAYDLAWEMGEKGRDYAKENVEPGFGPSAHDGTADAFGHRNPHDDTRLLQDNVEFRVERQGFIGIAQVFTDIEYGAWLEIGFHTFVTDTYGRGITHFWRYPWLKPAYDRLVRESASDLPSKISRMLTEQYSSSRNPVDEPDIRKWIRKEELEHFNYTEE